MPQLKTPHATTKAWQSQINKYIFFKRYNLNNTGLISLVLPYPEIDNVIEETAVINLQ